MNEHANRSRALVRTFLGACAVLAIIIAGLGCNSSEKEKEPIVSVQVTPAKRSPLDEIVSAEAVIYPRQQAVLIPKIASTIKRFLVQRGSRVTRVSCSRSLKMPTCRPRRSRVKENWSRPRPVTQPLPAPVFHSKYKKLSLTQRRQERRLMRKTNSTRAARSYSSKARFRDAISTAPTSLLPRPAPNRR